MLSILRLGLVEFHVIITLLVFSPFQISLFTTENGREINTLQLFIIFIYDISQEEVKKLVISRLLRRLRSPPWLLCSLSAPWGPPPVHSRHRRWRQSWHYNYWKCTGRWHTQSRSRLLLPHKSRPGR